MEVLIALFIGVIAGVITGLIPGVHVNLVMVVIGSLSLSFNPILLSVFIISLAITHTFVDAIPAIFLGAPNGDMAVASLPGHKMLLMGKGFEALKLTAIGGILCMIITIGLIPFIIKYLETGYDFIQPHIGYILIFILLWMIYLEKGVKKFYAIYVITQAGVFGLLTLNLPNLTQPLFPIFTGLFGVSTLILSLKNQKIPKQKKRRHVKVGIIKSFRAVFAGIIGGSLTGLLPGIGASQASIIGMLIAGRRIGKRALLIVLGGANTVNFAFSIGTLYAINKARNGALIAVQNIMEVSYSELKLFLIVSLIAGSLAVILTIGIGKIASILLGKINYRILAIGIIIFILILCIFISGLLGLLVLLIATFIGLMPALLRIKRSHNMAVLIVPVILFYLI